MLMSRRTHNLVENLLSSVPEQLKAPFREVLGKDHPEGLARSERRRLQRLLPKTPTVTTLYGRPWVVTDAPSFLGAHHDIFVEQQYRFRPDSAAPRILDVGANIGVASLYFARQYPTARIEAFEADPALHEILVRNLSVHHECAKVRALSTAVWTCNGTIPFRSDGADGGAIHEQGAMRVPALRLADVLAESPVDFMKLDIEGAECAVLDDCSSSLRNVNALIVEYHGPSGAPPQLGRLLRILESAGFRYHLHPEGMSNPHPLAGIVSPGRFELQVNISCIRE